MPPLLPLDEIDLHVTTRCNLKCKFCSVRANEHTYPDLPLSNIKEVIITAKTLGLKHLHLTGGEPTLRSDLEEIINFATKQNIETRLITNGYLLDKYRLRRLHESGLVNIMISIDGFASTHNEMRGNNMSWESAMNCLHAALELGFNTRVSSAVFKNNILEIPDFMESLGEIGIDIYSVFLGSPLGRGEMWKNQIVTPHEWRNLVNQLTNKLTQEKFNPSMQVVAEQAFVWSEKVEKIDLTQLEGRGVGCATIGKVFDYLIIKGDGNIYPCIFAIHDGVSLGNVLKQPLAGIYSDIHKKNPYQAWKLYDDNCFACKFNSLCQGGCRGYAYLYFNNWLKKDPRCQNNQQSKSLEYFPLCPIAKLNLRTNKIGGSSEQALFFSNNTLTQ